MWNNTKRQEILLELLLLGRYCESLVFDGTITNYENGNISYSTIGAIKA